MTLDQEISLILQKLSLLSEAPSGQPASLSPPADLADKGKKPRPGDWGVQGKSQVRHSDSRIPDGVDIERPSDKPPPKDRSLYDWFLWHFTFHQDSPGRLVSLLTLAEHDYRQRVSYNDRRLALRKGELTDNDIRDGGAAERAANERVVEWYAGLTPLQVALTENTTEQAIRKARREHDRDPDTGHPRPEFLKWSDAERRHRIERFESMQRGLGNEVGNKSIAAHFGVNPQTIARYRGGIGVATSY